MRLYRARAAYDRAACEHKNIEQVLTLASRPGNPDEQRLDTQYIAQQELAGNLKPGIRLTQRFANALFCSVGNTCKERKQAHSRVVAHST